MSKLLYTWMGLWTIGGRNGNSFCIAWLGKCIDGWKNYYGDQKPWKVFGYSNPIFCKSKNWGYDKMLDCNRVVFCFLWFNIQWNYKRKNSLRSRILRRFILWKIEFLKWNYL